MWSNNIPPRPTKRDLESQIAMGLADSGTRYRHGTISDMQLGSTIRRALLNGMPVIRVAQLAGLSVTKCQELEKSRYVGGYDEPTEPEPTADTSAT